MEQIRYVSDRLRNKEYYKIVDGQVKDSSIKMINDVTGEVIFEEMHNKTVVAGSALIAMKLFNLDRNVLDNTPTYDTALDLHEGASGLTYPVRKIVDGDGNVVGTVSDECQRTVCGFCLGQGGAGLDISDVFDVKYASWITPDDIIPFRYPLANADDVPEEYYKGKKLELALSNGQIRNAYYFKTFSNTPKLQQNYVTSIGLFSDSISRNTVYQDVTNADKAQSYVELHLKITKDDLREFFITHKGLENAKFNQIQLVSAWTKTVTVEKLNSSGSMEESQYEYFQDIRPFSILNIPNEIMSDIFKSVSIIYTLFF